MLMPDDQETEYTANDSLRAVKELGLEATIEKVEDFKDIMAYGVMRTPALVVDEQVKIIGRVPSVEDIKRYL